MPSTAETLQRVESAIEAVRPQRTGPVTWAAAGLSAGDPRKTILRLDEDWLTIEAALRLPSTRARLWPLLLANARVSGPARVALSGRDVVLRGDIALDDEVGVAGRLADVWAGLCELAASAAGDTGGGDGGGAPSGAAGASGAGTDLRARIEATGWSCVERRDQSLLVDLRVPGQFRQAVVRDDGGAVRLSVDLVTADALPPATREALGAFLLSMSRACRMVRGVARERNGSVSAALEVGVAAPATVAEIGHALAALAVACRQAGREAAALRDERLATTYLGLRGFESWSASVS